MSDDDSERVVSYKEAARMRQRAAYQKAKAERAKDPRYLAMKQAAKEQRRAAYQEAKQRHKAHVEKVKRQRAAEEEERRAQARAKADTQLLELVTWLGKGSSAQN